MIAVVLLGCPYIFGPPDHGAPTDTATTDPVLTTPTEPTSTDPVPTVEILAVTPRLDGWRLQLGLHDDDLVGATLKIVSGTTRTWVIPDDLLSWSPSGEAVLDWLDPLPCAGTTASFGVTVTDLAGHASEIVTTQVSVTGADTPADLDPVDLATQDLPFTWCGTLDAPDDVDTAVLTGRGAWGPVHLGWSPSASNLDLAVLDGTGLPVGITVTDAPPPETLDLDLPGGEPWTVRIEASDDATGTAWQVLVEARP